MKTQKIINKLLPLYERGAERLVFMAGPESSSFDNFGKITAQDPLDIVDQENEAAKNLLGDKTVNKNNTVDPMPKVDAVSANTSKDDFKSEIDNLVKINMQNDLDVVDAENKKAAEKLGVKLGPTDPEIGKAQATTTPEKSSSVMDQVAEQREATLARSREIFAKMQSLDLSQPGASQELNALREELRSTLPSLDSPGLTPEQKDLLAAANDAEVARQTVLNYGVERRTKYLSAHGKSFGEVLTKGDGGDVVRSAIIIGLIAWGAFKALKSEDGKGKAIGVAAALLGVGLATQYAGDGKFKAERLWNKQDRLDHDKSMLHMGNINKMQELHKIDGLAEATKGMIVRRDSPAQRPGQISLEEFFDRKQIAGGPFTMTDEDLKSVVGLEDMPNFTGKPNEEVLRKNYYTELFGLYSVCQKNTEPTVRDAVRGFSAMGNYVQAGSEWVTGSAMGAAGHIKDKAKEGYDYAKATAQSASAAAPAPAATQAKPI